jgi:Helix-turn-helix domain
VDQRLQFLSSYQKKEMSVSELCREFGVSRATGYRFIHRYNESGPEGLLNLKLLLSTAASHQNACIMTAVAISPFTLRFGARHTLADLYRTKVNAFQAGKETCETVTVPVGFQCTSSSGVIGLRQCGWCVTLT